MKLLVVSTAVHGGGAEYVARTWAGGLSKRGHDVTICVTGSVVSKPGLEMSVPVLSLGRGNAALKIRRLHRLLSDGAFDAVVSLQTFPNLVAIAASELIPGPKRPRVYVSERNLVSLGIPGSSASHRAKIRAARSLYRRAHGAIAISHPVAAEMVSWFGVPGSKCTVVPNPATAKTESILSPVMRPLDLDAPITVIMPARLVPQKQPLLAILAAKELKRRGRDVQVVSFGSGPLQDEVSSLASSSGVPFTSAGWVENWCADLPPNSVVVLSSVREGFGNVLVEAASVGVPSVALSSALGVADAIVPGITGELALKDNPVSVADAVESCSLISPVDVTSWLNRYSVEASVSALEYTIRDGSNA